ncbi:atrial natriuretic peptide receptor 1-like [Paramacrobiotus metropolitanus]|uniref:atrial natriuretic peptide receptor 1-like n=1 Tax=Paramacrobiotus metropolitanus TaxID=2943436 RepID=UPI0024463C6A|nr:atrial natriuretic peptide receptor 1-like [Paramacrobiotus metropolitanus]
MMSNSDVYGYEVMMPAYDATLSAIRKKYPLVSNHLTVLPILNLAQYMPKQGYSYPCDYAYEAIMPFVSAYYYQHLRALQRDLNESLLLILAVDWCDSAQLELAKFTTAADLLFLSLSPANGDLDQFQNFPTMAELGTMPAATLEAGVAALLLHFGWTRNIGLWCPTHGIFVPAIFCDAFVQSELYSKVGANQFHVFDPEVTEFSPVQYRQVLTFMRTRTRGKYAQTKASSVPLAMIINICLIAVIIVFMYPQLVRQFMIVAHEMNMTNGEYVFLTLAFDLEPGVPYRITWRENEEDDGLAFQAFRSLIAVASFGVQWDDLGDDLFDDIARISVDVYNVTLPSEKIRNEAPAIMYDLLMNFAEAVNRSWDNAEYFRPRTFAQRLKDQMYNRPSSVTKLARDGSAAFRVPILRLNTANGQMETAAVFDAENRTIDVVQRDLWTWHNQTQFPSNYPVCGFDGQHCPDHSINLGPIFAGVALLIIIAISLFAGWLYRRKANRLIISHMFLKESLLTFESTNESFDGKQIVSYSDNSLQMEHQPVHFLRISSNTSLKTWFRNNSLTSHLLIMHRLTNENVGIFYGALVNASGIPDYLMGEYSYRGSLWEIMTQKNILNDMSIRLSFVYDFLKGICYIHTSPLHYHGHLSMRACFINSRFTLKVGQAGYQRLFNLLSSDTKTTSGSRSDDVFQFGKICSDVITSQATADTRTKDNLIQLNTIIESCLSTDPSLRPTCHNILQVFRKLPKLPKNVVAHMLSQLDRQAHDLEEKVKIKTADLVDEMRKSDSLLAEILPRSIIQRLRNKEPITAESFSSVSILFSDIPAFAVLLRCCTPIELISILNDTHSNFDGIVHDFNAYKVETIGDCYMISSGVPLPNVDHAVELCRLGSALLAVPLTFRSAHDVVLTARIGINSGPVVAGVIGTKSPRYCLFGDTVNTASRMESTGSAGKVHLSPTTYGLAVQNSALKFVSRGEISVKGKGSINTYWLDTVPRPNSVI